MGHSPRTQILAKVLMPKLDLTNFTAIIDTREQLPLELKLKDGTVLPQRRGTLKTGDYSVEGYQDGGISIERKSLSDLMGTIGKGRERFEREIDRLVKFEVKAIVVEGSWRCLEFGSFRSRVHPQAAVGSLLSWISRGIPVLMLENRDRASEYVARLLIHGYKRLSGRNPHGEEVDHDLALTDPLERLDSAHVIPRDQACVSDSA